MPLAPPLTVEDALARLAGGLDTSQPDQMPISAPGIFAPPPPRPMAPPPAQGPQGVPWGEILKSAMPFIMAGLAAKQGGRGAAGAILTGYAVAGEAKRRTDIAALEQQNQAIAAEDARQENYRRYAQGQAEKGATFFRETVSALSGIGDPAQLASATEMAERVGQSVYGFNPGVFQSLSLAPKSTWEKDSKDAREALAALEKEHGENAKRLSPETPIWFQGKYKALKDIRALAGVALPEGVIVPPVPKAPGAMSDFEDYLSVALEDEAAKRKTTPDKLSTAERRAITLQARKEFQQIDDRPAQAGTALSAAGETALINRLTSQWDQKMAPIVALDRQVRLMETGLKAAERGDLAQGAQAVLVTFQKILDPTSVVRESEYARSGQGLALDERLRGYFEQLSKGGAGVPLVELEKFAKLAREAADAQKAGYIADVKARIGRMADRYKIPQDLIFETTGEGASAAGEFSVVAPDGKTYRFPTQAALDAFKKKAGIR